MALAANLVRRGALQHADRPAASLIHASGTFVLPYWIRGGASAVLPSFAPADFAAAIGRYRATEIDLVPTMFAMLLGSGALDGADLSSLRRVVCGASPMPRPLLRSSIDTFGPILTQYYGQTEAPLCIAALSPVDHADESLWGACGQPSVDVDVRLVDEPGSDVTSGEIGEIARSSPSAPAPMRTSRTSSRTCAGGSPRTRRRSRSTSSRPSPGPRSEGNYLHQPLDPGEVRWVARVEPSTMCVCRRSDQKIHDPTPRLSPRLDNGCGQAAVADGHRLVDRQRVEVVLQQAQAPEPLGSDRGGLGNQDPEVQLGQRDGADRKHSRQRSNALGEDHARIEDRALGRGDASRHRRAHGSRTRGSSRSLSCSHSLSVGPWNSSAMSSQFLHRVGRAATRRALGRPETVMMISSPASTRRTRSDAA